MSDLKNKETNYVLNLLKTLQYKNRIEIPNKISKDFINSELIPYYKIEYYLENLDFYNAEKLLLNIPKDLYTLVSMKVKTSKEFYNKYNIYYCLNNSNLISELKNKYFINYLKTTPCTHDKSGTLMRINCYKCS
jgi:hypothetical protein